jgi:hypothetical protein
MAQENTSWGYCWIQGELKQLGHWVAPSTIARVLKDNGIKPARPTVPRPGRRSWRLIGVRSPEWTSSRPRSGRHAVW